MSSVFSIPPIDRQRKLNSIFVNHTKFQEATETIERFHMPVLGGMHGVGCLSVIAGDSRTGKSCAVSRYAARYPQEVVEGGLKRPVVVADMPIEGGPRAVLESVAEALSVPTSQRTPNDGLIQILRRALAEMEVELLIFDEAQELFSDLGSKRRLLPFARGLIRKLLNLQRFNIICVGLSETYRFIADEAQLTGRGGLPYRMLSPYSWNDESEQKLFRYLCRKIDDELPFETRSDLEAVNVAHRLFYASQGNIGRLMDLIRAAGARAINDNANSIEMGHFADVYAERMPPGDRFNPFVHDASHAPKAKSAKRILPPAQIAFSKA